jgi:hypothetical protein
MYVLSFPYYLPTEHILVYHRRWQFVKQVGRSRSIFIHHIDVLRRLQPQYWKRTCRCKLPATT